MNAIFHTRYGWYAEVMCLILNEPIRFDITADVMGVASNEAEEARASSLFCVRTHTRIGDVL